MTDQISLLDSVRLNAGISDPTGGPPSAMVQYI